LEVLSWEVLNLNQIPNIGVQQKLLIILNDATASGKLELVIPALTLEEFSEYTFKVTFQNIFLK